MGSVSKELREIILERDGHRCRYCGSRKEPLQIDHVYPLSAGGQTILENLVVACYKCNMAKRDKVGIWPMPSGYFSNPLRRLLVFWWSMLRPYSYKTPRVVNPEQISRIAFTERDTSGNVLNEWNTDLPVDMGTLIKVCEHLYSGGDFSLASLGGPYKPLSRSQFESLRDVMIADGLARWKDENAHNLGAFLTHEGLEMVKHFATLKEVGQK